MKKNPHLNPFAGHHHPNNRTQLIAEYERFWIEYYMNETGGVSEDGSSEVYLVILPIIITLGLGGNIISLVTIFHSRLRHISANVYLIVLTAADSVFLFGVALICFKIDFVSWEWCVFVEYILMVASYVSSWATAALTIERYLAIAHPLKHVIFGHVDRWKMLIYWLPIPFVLHLFQFINLVPNPLNGKDERKCVLREANYQVVSEFLDVLLCFGIPCAVVVILNLLVMGKVNRERGHFLEQQGKQLEGRRQGGSGSGGFTRILWVVPMVFVILNTPFYCIRMYEAFIASLSDNPSPEASDPGSLYSTVYNAAHYLYYINFASDVVVYAFSSANFRKTVVIAWRRIICPGYDKSRATKYTITLQNVAKTRAFFQDQKVSTRSCLITNSSALRPPRRSLSQRETGRPRILPDRHSDAEIHMIKSCPRGPPSLNSIVHYHEIDEMGNGSTAF